MSKTTRKGVKIGIPSIIGGWYEQTIEGLKVDVKKKKNADLINAQFQNFLLITEQDFELRLWGYRASYNYFFDKEVEFWFYSTLTNTIGMFNDIRQKFDASTISEDLLNHLQRQIKSILLAFKSYEEISGQNEEQLKKDTINALKQIHEKETDIWLDMMSYFKKEESSSKP